MSGKLSTNARPRPTAERGNLFFVTCFEISTTMPMTAPTTTATRAVGCEVLEAGHQQLGDRLPGHARLGTGSLSEP